MRRYVYIVSIVLMLVSCNAVPANKAQQGGDNTKDIGNSLLLYRNSSPFTSGDGLQFLYNNLYNPKTLKDEEAKIINTTIKEEQINFITLSADGSKALFETLDFLPKYKVFDIRSKQLIFEIEDSDYDTSLGQFMHLKFLPNLTKFIKIKEDGCYLCSINGKSSIKLKNLNNVNIFDCVFSPDESKIAFIEEIGVEKYIIIYDLTTMKNVKKIMIGNEDIYISQWHSSGKLLYNYHLNGYMIDIETGKVKDLGKYSFYPMLSPDGRYLVYSHPITFVYIDSMLDIDEAYENTAGLYILDNMTGKNMKLDTDEYFQQEPILWIDKEAELLIK